MKIVILHGGKREHAGMAEACSALTGVLERRGDTVHALHLGEMQIRACAGCFGCWLRTPGECVIDDGGREVARQLAQSDARVFLSPVTFGGYSSSLKRALDRCVPTISPLFTHVNGEMRHRRRYPNAPICLGLGWQEEPDEDAAAAFTRLVWRNSLNFHSPAQGAVVLNAGQTTAQRSAAIEDVVRKTLGDRR